MCLVRNPFAVITAKTPVSFSPVRTGISIPFLQRNNSLAQIRTMGSVGTLFQIVHRLSNATSQAEWRLYRSAKSGKKEDRVEVTAHAALDLWNKPNKFMTRQELIESFQQHLDLTGEAWLLTTKFGKLPLELWPVRPDRIAPIPHPTDFISHYEYTEPDGKATRLATDEVIFMRMPNPEDPFRGMGPVQSILTDLDATKYSAEWNRNFFLNSAEPGGIIEVSKTLQDVEFNEMRDRWNEQHKGVANAHRVALIEQGKWVNRTFTMRDMQFAELRSVASEVIREAFGFPKPMLGTTDDVNLANAIAGEYVFAKWHVTARLDRIKAALNADLLPMYGATGKGLEFDYDSPVPADRAADNSERESRAATAKIYIDLGFDVDEVCDALDIPRMSYEKPALPAPPAPPMPGDDPAEQADPAEPPTTKEAAGLAARLRSALTNEDDPLDDIDLTPVQAAWVRAVQALLTQWQSLAADQRAQLVEQIIRAVDSSELGLLASMSVDSDATAEALTVAMVSLAATAGEQVAAEAVVANVAGVSPVPPPTSELAATASTVAALLAAELALAAGREALRILTPTSRGSEVAEAVTDYLAERGGDMVKAELGAALTSAQTAGRLATYRAGPVASLYANEQMDGSTCENCREIHGRFLGISTDGTDMDEINKTYPHGGYVDCVGARYGNKCRGTVTGVWRSKKAGR